MNRKQTWFENMKGGQKVSFFFPNVFKGEEYSEL